MPWYFYSNGLPVVNALQGTLPVGSISMTFLEPTDTLPDGYLVADGATLNPTTYATLFAVYGTKFGGNGITTFNLPNLQGKSPRGTTSGATLGYLYTGGTKSHGGANPYTHTIPNHSHTMTDRHRHTVAGFSSHTHTMDHTHQLRDHYHDGYLLNVQTPSATVARKSGAGVLTATSTHQHSASVFGITGTYTGGASSSNASPAVTSTPSGGDVNGTTDYWTGGSTQNQTTTVTTNEVSNLPPYLTLTFLVRYE